jgi:hypothetical protein
VAVGLQAQGRNCTVTVYNAGNRASSNVQIGIYQIPFPLAEWGDPRPIQVASTSTSLGLLEKADVSLTASTVSLFGSLFAIVFDPLNDPFPTDRLSDLAWNESNVLAPYLRDSLPGWAQYDFPDDDLAFTGGEAASSTWTLRTPAELEGDIPADASIRRVLFPGTTKTANSELRADVHLSDIAGGAFAAEEARRGNVSAQAACQIYNYTQNPRDRGDLSVALLHEGAIVASAPRTPMVRAYTHWQALTRAAGPVNFDAVRVRLLANRRTGSDNNAYFGDVSCVLKHRQVKRLSGGTQLHHDV